MSAHRIETLAEGVTLLPPFPYFTYEKVHGVSAPVLRIAKQEALI